MKKNPNKIPIDNNIIQIPFDEAMPDNYLPYAVEVARDRALPDVRDGLKPVHRRIIYGSYLLKAFHDRPYLKSARIVGDVLGKFHPHGDSSVYDAIVILAQNFSTRVPLIDGQGNWGSEDGDSAAAMRYTEARMTPIALELIRDIDKDVVDMADNYSSTEKEPVVLPARYPNLLVNGTFGIAVGLATNIPPHNLGEAIDGTIALIDNKDIDTKELMKYIKAPDLPTGGVVIGYNSMLNAYETGEGKVCQRAKASIEKLENGRLGIVITEFTYRKSKARILQTISAMTQDKKSQKILESISDIRDESDRTGTRAVIEFKKSVEVETCEKVLKYLYRKTDLQINIPFNMVAIVNGKPKTLNLKEILNHYIEHQKEVITRRTNRELEIVKNRHHIVEGFIKAIEVLDEVIKTIRESKSRKDAEGNIMEKFGFTQIQANAILELMLYRLTGLELKVFLKEYDELIKKIARLEKILSSEKELLKVIKKELIEVKEKYADPRRTKIIEEEEESKIDLDDFFVSEDVIVTMSNEGFIKRVPLKSYNRSSTNVEDIEYREGDYNVFLIQCNTKDSIIIFTSKGNMYQLKVKDIPEFKWREKGEKLDTLVRTSDFKDETYIAAFGIDDFNKENDLYFMTSLGMFKKVPLLKFSTSYSKIQGIKLRENDTLVCVKFEERNRERKYLTLITSLDLKFNIEEPFIEDMERSVLGHELIRVSHLNSVVDFEFSLENDYKEFGVKLVNGMIKVYPKDTKDTIKTNSLETVIFCDVNANMYKLPSVIIQNTNEVSVNKLLSLSEKVEILRVFSISDYKEDISLISVTSKGYVKRTALSEFKECGFKAQFHKFKFQGERIVSAFLSSEGESILIITERAMGIKFLIDSINNMGRLASGVIGIALKNDDLVVFSDNVNNGIKGNVILKTNKKNNKTLKITDIKFQNRAGVGSNLLMVLFDEKLISVLLD